MALKIPKEDQLGISILSRMADDIFQAFMIEIERPQESTPSIKGVSDADMKQAWDAIRAMHRVRQRYEVDLEEFVPDILESLRQNNTIPKEDESLLAERLSKVLSVHTLSIAAKATAIGNEHEHVFCNARIFTDLRPVFKDDAPDLSGVVVISHQLKLEYHKSPRGVREIYLALSSDDIRELRVLLDRAEQKAATIKSSLAASKLKFVEPKHGGNF